MPDDNTSTANGSQNQDANAGGQQAADSNAGAGTQTAQSTEGKQQTQQQQQTNQQQTADNSDTNSDKKFTQEDLDKYLTQRLDKKLRKELIKRGIDPDEKDTGKDAKPTVETVTKERDDIAARLRIAEARDQLESFVADKRNNLTVSNVRGLFKYIKDDLEFDEDGKVTNFKDVLAQAKVEAGEFFRAAVGSADGGRGNGQVANVDMNALIRGR